MEFSPSPVLVEAMVVLSCVIYLFRAWLAANNPVMPGWKKTGMLLLAYAILVIAPTIFFGDVFAAIQSDALGTARDSMTNQAKLFFGLCNCFCPGRLFCLRRQRLHRFAGMLVLVLINCLMCVAAHFAVYLLTYGAIAVIY